MCASTYKIKMVYDSVRLKQFLCKPFSENIVCQSSSCFTFLKQQIVLFMDLF